MKPHPAMHRIKIIRTTVFLLLQFLKISPTPYSTPTALNTASVDSRLKLTQISRPELTLPDMSKTNKLLTAEHGQEGQFSAKTSSLIGSIFDAIQHQWVKF